MANLKFTFAQGHRNGFLALVIASVFMSSCASFFPHPHQRVPMYEPFYARGRQADEPPLRPLSETARMRGDYIVSIDGIVIPLTWDERANQREFEVLPGTHRINVRYGMHPGGRLLGNVLQTYDQNIVWHAKAGKEYCLDYTTRYPTFGSSASSGSRTTTLYYDVRIEECPDEGTFWGCCQKRTYKP